MITPDFNLVLWIILFSWFLSGISRVVAGCVKLEKDTHYGTWDAIVGLVEIIIVVWLVVK